MTRYIRMILGVLLLSWGCTGDHARQRAAGGTVADETAHTVALRGLTIRGDAAREEPLFLRAVDATRLSTGAIVVADAFRFALLFFDSAGNHIRTVGRRGSGPTEFESLSWLLRCSGDSIYAWDSNLMRISVIDSSGSVVRHFRPSNTPFRMACVPDGPLAILQQPRIIERMDPEGRALRKYSGMLWLADTDGDTTSVIGEFDVGENRPLGRLTTIALAADRVYVGTAESASVDVRGFDGRQRGAVEIPVHPREPTQQDYERAVDAMVEGFTDRDYQLQMKSELLKIPKPDLLPPYSSILSDVEGTLWVVTSAPADSTTQLQIVASNGCPLGNVSLPANTRPLEVGVDYLLALEESDTGQQQIVVYEVQLGAVRPRCEASASR